jgi:hypothetical protein
MMPRREKVNLFLESNRSEFAMSSFIKVTVLGLGLIAGAAFAAQAQTAGSVSSLPPGGVSNEGPSAVAPSGNYPGPNLGTSNAPVVPRTQATVEPSGNYPGPATGAGNGVMPPHFNKPAGYDDDASLSPYTKGLGPKVN